MLLLDDFMGAERLQFAVVVDRGVVNRNHAIPAVRSDRVVLEPFEPMLIDSLDLPQRFSQPPIERQLVGSGGDRRDHIPAEPSAQICKTSVIK